MNQDDMNPQKKESCSLSIPNTNNPVLPSQQTPGGKNKARIRKKRRSPMHSRPHTTTHTHTTSTEENTKTLQDWKSDLWRWSTRTRCPEFPEIELPFPGFPLDSFDDIQIDP